MHLKFINYILIFFLLPLTSCFLLKKNKSAKPESSNEEKKVTVLTAPVATVQKDTVQAPVSYHPKDSVGTVTLSAAGDLMCHITQYNYAKIDGEHYDFNPTFSEIKHIISNSDFALGNLETTCAGAGTGYSGYPNFNSPDEFVEAIKNAGFDLLVTSNNHSMDMNEKGLLRTIDIIQKNNLSYTGTFKTQSDRDSVRIFLLNGIKLCVLNYTYGTNGMLPSQGHEYYLNVIDTILIKNDIALARKKNAEIVLVYFHYGAEYITEPTAFQRQIAGKTIEYGADIIIGSHPHVLQPAEFFKTINAKLDSGFIAWSLGNFISNQKDRYCDAGAILNISLSKNFANNTIWISEVNYIPTWVYRGTNEGKKKHIIFPSEYCLKDTLPDFLDDNSKALLQRAHQDANDILLKKSGKVKMKSVLRNEREKK